MRAELRIEPCLSRRDRSDWWKHWIVGEDEVLAMPRELLDSALATETPQPVAALVKPPDWTWAHVLVGTERISAADRGLGGLQDPGNLGQSCGRRRRSGPLEWSVCRER